MKESIKAILRKIGELLYPRDLNSHLVGELLKSQTNEKAAQLILQQNYQSLLHVREPSLPSLTEVGFRKYSQFDEDGILLFLFSIIRPENRICLEICAGNGIECNTANLIINHGWWGYLFDGNADNVERGQAYYATHQDTFLYPPVFQRAWVTAENVNDLVLAAGLKGKIDLLSLDIDGNDYWIWQAIAIVEPTIVICEVHNIIPPELALTIPYEPNFVVADADDDFRGASLRAMVNLGRSKGYRLVGTHRYGFNAFFVKNGIGRDVFPEVSPEQCANDPYTRLSRSTRWPRVKDKNWVKV